MSCSKNTKDKSDALARIGRLMLIKPDYHEARKYFLEAVKENRSSKIDPQIYLGLGKAEYELGNKKKAEEFLLKAFNERERTPELKYSTYFEGDLNHCLGVLHYENKKIPLALSCFHRAEKCLQEEYYPSFNNLKLYIGHCYLFLKDYSKAESAYQEILKSEFSTEEEKNTAKYSMNRSFPQKRNDAT